MRANRTWADSLLTMVAIFACILLHASAYANDSSVNEQLLSAAENGSLDQVNTLLATMPEITRARQSS